MKCCMEGFKIKLVVLLGVLIGGNACSYHFEVDEMENTPKLVLYAFPGNQDTTWVQVSESMPIGKKGSGVVNHPEAAITCHVNGQVKEMKRADGSDPDVAADSYYLLGKFTAGDQVTFSAESPGLPTVSSQTKVPEMFPLKTVRLVKKLSPEGAGAMIQFQITFQDNGATTDYYGVRIEKMEERWDENEPFGEIHDYSVNAINLGLEEEPLLKQGSLDEVFFEYNGAYKGLYVFPDTQIQNREYTLHLNTYFSENYESEYGNYWYHYYYRVTLFSLSPEYYLYVKHLIDQQNNNLGDSGLSPIRPSYTNVINGLGIVGGYMMYQSEWFENFK